MKKSMHKTSQRRKLVLHRETVLALTIPQLRQVAGGALDGTTNQGCSYTCGGCVGEQ